jgi:hypothetical protein
MLEAIEATQVEVFSVMLCEDSTQRCVLFVRYFGAYHLQRLNGVVEKHDELSAKDMQNHKSFFKLNFSGHLYMPLVNYKGLESGRNNIHGDDLRSEDAAHGACVVSGRNPTGRRLARLWRQTRQFPSNSMLNDYIDPYGQRFT